MSTRNLALLVSLAALVAAGALAQTTPSSPRLGRPATPEEIARLDIGIAPDGTGLPPGSGSVAQGAAIFQQKCQSCHGPAGAGTPSGDRLAGGIGSLATPNYVKTVNSYWPYATTLFDYIRRAMPIQAPQSLENNEVYALVAYILSLDGVVPQDAVLDAQSLPRVQMPNRDGFINFEPHQLRP